MKKLMVFSIYNMVIQILREREEMQLSHGSVFTRKGRKKKSIETTIYSLELLVKLHSRDPVVRTKITQIDSLCSCGVCEKQA